MARPIKLTPYRQSKIRDAIGIGAHRELAARYAGICQDTLHDWLGRGRAEEERRLKGEAPDEKESCFVRFLHAVEEAEANAGIGWAQVIDKAAQTDPVWAWKMLKLRFPDGFHETDRQQVGVLNVDMEHLTDEQLDRLAAGEDIYAVLANAGQGGTRTETKAESAKQADPAA